jgi:hypothetical protein
MAQIPTFYEWLALKSEGLWMPDKAAVPGMSRINPFPATQKQLKAILPKKPKAPTPFKATVAKVGSIPKPSFGPVIR